MADLGWVTVRSFEVGALRFAIRTTSQEFALWLDHALADYRHAEPAEIHYSVVVGGAEQASRRGGDRLHVLYQGCTPLIRTLNLATLAKVLLADLEHPLLEEREDALYARAASMQIRDTTVVVPTGVVTELGRLGRGTQRKGLVLPVSMRTIAIDPTSGRLVPVRPLLKVPDDAIAALPEPTRSNGHPERLTIDRPQEAEVICTPAQAPNGDFTVWSRPRAAVLHELATTLLNHIRLGGQRSLDGLARLVGEARCFGIRGGAPRDLAASLALAVTVPERR